MCNWNYNPTYSGYFTPFETIVGAHLLGSSPKKNKASVSNISEEIMHQFKAVHTLIMSSGSDHFNRTSGWKETLTLLPSSYNLPKFHTKSAMKNAETFIYQTNSASVFVSPPNHFGSFKNHGGNHAPSCGSCVLTCNSSGRSKTKAF